MRFFQNIVRILLMLQSALSFPQSIIFGRETSYDVSDSAGGYIFGQKSLSGQRLYFAHAENTACEVAAIYNALKYHKIGVPFKRVKRAFLRAGALTLFFFGFFGGNPYSLSRPARILGLKLKKTPMNEIGRGSFIFSFFNPHSLSIHTVFCTRGSHGFTAYNFYGTDRVPRRIDLKNLEKSIIICYKIDN